MHNSQIIVLFLNFKMFAESHVCGGGAVHRHMCGGKAFFLVICVKPIFFYIEKTQATEI